MVEECCPIVSHSGQAFEKLGKPEIAMELYQWMIKLGCLGTLPFTRLVILREKDCDYAGAIEVCDKALANTWFNGPTREGATEEFTERKTRCQAKLEKASKG